MQNTMKYLCLLTAFLFTAVCYGQAFTVGELINLSSQNVDEFKNSVSNKGYVQEKLSEGAMSQQYEFSSSSNSKILLIMPTFQSDVRMVSWEFNSASVYDALKRELVKDNYKQENTERRHGGKYLSLYYSKPGYDIILTSDRTGNLNEQYIISVKYTNAEKYLIK